MAITELTDDLNIVAALDDEPNDTGGLTASQLKAKFDEAGNKIKTYINDELIPDVEAEVNEKVAAAELASGNVPTGGTTGQALLKDSDTDYDAAWGTPGDSTATPNAVMRRDASGRAQVADPVDDADIANKGFIDSKTPVGSIKITSEQTVGENFFLCNGSYISKDDEQQYPELSNILQYQAKTWDEIGSFNTNTTDVIYGKGYWVMVGTSNSSYPTPYLYWSTDLIHWHGFLLQEPTGDQYRSYNNGKGYFDGTNFVVVYRNSRNNNFYYWTCAASSPPNLLANWGTGRAIGNETTSCTPYKIFYDGSKMVLFTTYQGRVDVYYSRDHGVNWSPVVHVSTDGYLRDIQYLNGEYLVVLRNDSNTASILYRSADATTWSSQSLPDTSYTYITYDELSGIYVCGNHWSYNLGGPWTEFSLPDELKTDTNREFREGQLHITCRIFDVVYYWVVLSTDDVTADEITWHTSYFVPGVDTSPYFDYNLRFYNELNKYVTFLRSGQIVSTTGIAGKFLPEISYNGAYAFIKARDI